MHPFLIAENKRQSNLELLRIVAMIMILVYHTVYYVLYDYRTETPIFSSLLILLHIGVPLFVLISGYFGIKPTIKGFFRLYSILVFYNLLFYGIRLVNGDALFTKTEFLRLWFPFSVGRRYWFFKVYIMLYIVSPILNYLTDNKKGETLLFITGFLTFYWGWFAHHPSLCDGKNVVNFVFLYLLGHYLRQFYFGEGKRRSRFVFLGAFLLLSSCVGIALYVSDARMMGILKRLFWGYNSPVLILISVLLFLTFTTFDFKNKLVNWVASSAFAVYLVHENHWFFRDQWYSLVESQYLNNSGGQFAILLLSECALFFVLAILLDKFRSIIFLPLMPLGNWLQKHSDLVCMRIKTQISRR